MQDKLMDISATYYDEANDFFAEIKTVADTTDAFDNEGQHFRPVPGMESLSFATWGDDNKRPYAIRDFIAGDEVTAQNKLTNILTCYGAGLKFIDTTTAQPTTDEKLKRWAMANALPKYFLDQITSMKYFYFSVCVFILSNDGTRINRIIHKDAASCRFQKADAWGRIRKVFFADWENSPRKVEAVSLLNETDPLGDLERRLGQTPRADGRKGEPTRERKFAMVMRFPTVTNPYYPSPYYLSIFRGGSYDEKRLISAGKRAKLRNSSSVKFLIEVSRDYWMNLLKAENITDPVKQLERINREKENIKNFALGIRNSGKVWISGFYVTPDGKEQHDVKITVVDTGKEGGDWADETTAATNTLCYADNVHPSLVGAVPGKSSMNNSGSDKRELFTMKQALETAFHDILLFPLQVVCYFNGWRNIEPSVPFIQLTTLDEHRDAKAVTV